MQTGRFSEYPAKTSQYWLAAFFVAALGFVPARALLASDPVPGPSASPSPAASASASPQAVAVVAITEDQRKCLETNPPEICFPDVKSATDAFPISDYNDELSAHLDELRDDLFADSVQINPVLTNGTIFTQIGVHLGGERLYDDEILSDPDRAATERAATSPGVWVRHTLELRPDLNKGRIRLNPSQDPVSRGEFSVGLDYAAILTLVKRHDLGKVYDADFWGYAKQDLKLIEQALPLYIKLPLTYRDLDYLPGEGITIERFGDFQFFAGINANIIGLPTFGQISIGIQARAGFQISHTAGLFETTLEMKQGGLARLTLERASDWSYGPYVSIGENATAGPISGLAENFADAGYQKESSKMTVLDLIVDLRNPQAATALDRAYSGDFTLAQQISSTPDAMSQADVLSATQAKITSHGTHKFWDFFFWGRNSSETKADEAALVTEIEPSPSPSASPQAEVVTEHYQDDTYENTGKGPKHTYTATVSSRTDAGVPQGASPEMALHYEFDATDSGVNSDQLLQFTNVALAFAPPANAADIQAIKQSVSASHNGHNGDARIRVSLDFSPQAFAAFLLPASENGSPWPAAFYVAWAKTLELPNAESWGTMSDAERDAAAQAAGNQVHDHFNKAKSFVKNVLKALTKTSVSDRAHGFLSAIHSLNDEIYPVSALIGVSGPDALLAAFRLTLQNGNQTRAVDFGYMGSQYHLPSSPAYELNSSP